MQVNFKLEKLIFQTRVNRVLASQKKFIAMNADRYMSKWANHCVTVISASGTEQHSPCHSCSRLFCFILIVALLTVSIYFILSSSQPH